MKHILYHQPSLLKVKLKKQISRVLAAVVDFLDVKHPMDNGDQFFRWKYQGFLISEFLLTKNITCLCRYQFIYLYYSVYVESPQAVLYHLSLILTDITDQPADHRYRRRESEQLGRPHCYHHQCTQPAPTVGTGGILGHNPGEHSTRQQNSGETSIYSTTSSSLLFKRVFHLFALTYNQIQ